MMAAGRAAERGRKTLLLEKNDILGKKLLISGKGRCNITNAGDIDDHLENFSRKGRFLRNAFSRVFNSELTDFFEKRGVPLKVERGKRVFPRSDRSKDILAALKIFLKDNGVDVVLQSEVKDIGVSADGVKTISLADGSVWESGTVALCTGGLSYPQTGSTGFGFLAAKKFGHDIIKPRPALVPLVADSDMPRSWQGLSLKNIKAGLIIKERRVSERFGDLIFTHFGLSGPTILDLSAEAFDLLQTQEEIYVSIDMKPALEKKQLDARLIRELSGHAGRHLKSVLKGLMPQRMIEGFAKMRNIDAGIKTNQVTRSDRKNIVDGLKDLRFMIKEARPIEEAIVTRGGVDTSEIYPKTMESKLVRGLFFAGELIDVDAKTGGYNMQAAFSTGYLCGDNL